MGKSSKTPKGESETRKEVSKTPRKFRAHRLVIDSLRFGNMAIYASHQNLGTFTGSVHDLSAYGLAVALPISDEHQSFIFVGDKLDELSVSYEGTTLFRGSATIRRIDAQPNAIVLGIEVESGLLDLAAVYRKGGQKSFLERFVSAISIDNDIPDKEFKAWVADLRSFLIRTREFLDKEEAALAKEDKYSRAEAYRTYIEAAAPYVVQRMDQASRELQNLVQNYDERQHAISQRLFQDQAYSLLAHSPFLRRAAEKPLGYAGDYEMMNMLYRDHAEGNTLFGKILNIYFARVPAAQANINRISFLVDEMRNFADAQDSPKLRLASVGCGPSREIHQLLHNNPEIAPRLNITLVDQEERAITYCERVLGPLALRVGTRVSFVRESVRSLLGKRRLSSTLGRHDYICSAGLFDYLSDRGFSMLLKSLYDAVSPGGILQIGNVSSENPSRWIMEYYANWVLNHRSKDQLLSFATSLEPTPKSVEVKSEGTELNLFLTIRR